MEVDKEWWLHLYSQQEDHIVSKNDLAYVGDIPS